MSGSEGAGRTSSAPDDVWLRLFVESVKDYAIFLLDPTGRVITWNPGAERMKGYTAGDIIGSHFSRFYPLEDIAADKPGRELIIAAAEGRVEDEGWRVRKDGSRFWASVVITAVRDETGRLVAFGKVTRDLTAARERAEENARLTERVQAHAEELEQLVAARTANLEQANEELRHVNQALETFAYSISHDLRGPLRAIQGFAEILIDEHADSLNSDGRDYLARIVAAAARLSDLVQNLLTYSRFARTTPLQAERVSLDRVCDDVLRELQPEITRARGDVAVRKPLGDVMGHREAIGLVLQNLLSNAMKFVPAGVNAHGEVWTESDGGHIRLHVRDNGIGVPLGEQARIFKPFERLHAQFVYAGTGLGLAIVAQAMTRLAGRYGVSSDGRTGSCFWFELPCVPRGDL